MYIEQKFFIRLQDIGISNKVTNKALLSFLEDAGGIHSNIAGYGLNNIEKTKLSWVILNWKLNLYALVISLYLITFSILFVFFFASSPFKSSDTSIFNSLAKGINKEISGVPLPVSHLEIAFSVTNNLFANSSCVMPNSFLFVLIRFDILVKSILFTY